MKKILLISDSHGYETYINTLLQKDYDYIFFMGDGLRDLGSIINLDNVYYVKGNCDYYFLNEPTNQTLFIENYKILITHGNEYNVKYGLETLENFALSKNYNIVCFGHTHETYIENRNGILFINPGALKNGKYVELEIDKNGYKILNKTI